MPPISPKELPVKPLGGMEPEPALDQNSSVDPMSEPTPGNQIGTPSIDIYHIGGEKPVLGKIAPEEVTNAVASGQYSLPAGTPIPVVSPSGEHGTIDPAEAAEAFRSGFKYATPNDLKIAKYSTPGQKALAALEGAGSALTFGGTTGIERLLDVPPEDIQGRREANPWTHAAGQMVGLIGSAIAAPEVGAAGLLGKAGAAGAEALGLAAPTTAVAKIGSAAVKGAIENAIFQGGDEVSKMLSSDPQQSIETAATDIGLSGIFGGVLGGGVGGAGALWDATIGGKTSGLLHALARKAGGIEGIEAQPIETVIDKSGLQVPAEIKARLSSDPEVSQMSKILEQSDSTPAGRSHQEVLSNFRKEAGDSIVRALGRDPEAVANMELSKYEAGKSIGKTLADEYHAQVNPLAEEFDALKNKYAKIELPQETIPKLSERIGEIAAQEGWTASPSSDIMKEVNRVLKELPLQKDIKDLGNYIRAVGNNMQSDPLNGPMRRAGGMIKGILKDAEADVIGSKLGATEGAEALNRYQVVRKAYADQSRLQEALDSRLHAKGSTSGYAKSLREMAQTDGEAVLRRLSGTNDADLLNVLRENFPRTAEAIKNYHLDAMLKTAMDKAKPGQTINAASLSKSLENLSPELRKFILPDETLSKVNTINDLLERLNNPHYNYSNTARAVDAMMKHVPGSAVGVATMLMGHNPAIAALLGALTNYVGKNVPDATRLALLKFLGSDKPINSLAFKSVVDTIHATMRGESLINKASKNLFRAGSEVIPASLLPTEKDRKNIDKHVKAIEEQPNNALGIGEHLAHYAPEHATSVTATATTAANYLSSIKPTNPKQSPLDKQQPVSQMQQAAYDRALNIAEQPLVVLKHIKEGTLLPQDLITLKTIYPSLYSKLSQKITTDMVDALDRGTVIPYKTRLGLSLFLGQAMDSTLTPEAINAAQPLVNQPQQPSDQQGDMKPKGRSMKSLDKLPGAYKTKSQKAETNPNGSRE